MIFRSKEEILSAILNGVVKIGMHGDVFIYYKKNDWPYVGLFMRCGFLMFQEDKLFLVWVEGYCDGDVIPGKMIIDDIDETSCLRVVGSLSELISLLNSANNSISYISNHKGQNVTKHFGYQLPKEVEDCIGW